MKAATATNSPAWHQLPAEEVARFLEVELAHGPLRRRGAAPPREIRPEPPHRAERRSELLRFILQFHQPLIYLLLAASVITAVLGEWVDASVIFGVVLVNAIVGYLQEAKAEKAIEALARMVITEATVRRDGVKQRVLFGRPRAGRRGAAAVRRQSARRPPAFPRAQPASGRVRAHRRVRARGKTRRPARAWTPFWPSARTRPLPARWSPTARPRAWCGPSATRPKPDASPR